MLTSSEILELYNKYNEVRLQDNIDDYSVFIYYNNIVCFAGYASKKEIDKAMLEKSKKQKQQEQKKNEVQS